MELLEEYQQALQKIKKLEEQIEDIREYVDTARYSLKTISNELEQRAKGYEPKSELQKAIVTHAFLCPKRMLDLTDKTLQLAFMDKEQRMSEESKMKIEMLNILKDKLSSLAVIDREEK